MAPTYPRKMIVVPVVAVALIVAGVIGIVIAIPQSASIGWFAYAPLSGAVFSPAGAVVVSWGAIAAAAVVALGLACLALWTGFILGISRARRAK